MIELSKCNRLLDEGFSLITVSSNKVPNYRWKEFQSKQITKQKFEKQYNYKGGYIYTDKSGNKQELPATDNVGIVTGFADLEVMDVDLKVLSTAKEQKEWWDEFISFLEDNILDFYDKFIITKTKSNGFHILYKNKNVDANIKIAKLKGHKEAILETRGKGGYVFIYDSFLKGKGYHDIDYVSDEDRNILWYCAKNYNYIEPSKPIIPNDVVKEFKGNEDGIKPWEDFNNKNNVWDIISSDFEIVRNLKDKYIIKRHGSTSPHSGYIYKDEDLMYLFSTATIYEHEKQYSAWTANVRKNFNDDFSAAAKQAYKDGYGSRIIKKEQEPVLVKSEIQYNDLSFPLDVFPEPIQKYILDCNRTVDSNIDYMGSSLLWLLSVVIGNSIKIGVKKGQWYERPSVWVAVVGKPGIGKTPSIKNILRPLQKINANQIKRYIRDRNKFDEYNALSKEDKKKHEEIKEPRKSQFIANDITIEALVSLHEESKNAVGVFKDELAGWFKDMNKYREGSDLEFWLSTWSGESVNVNRITRVGSFLNSPHIPVLGGIQPSILNSFYTDENKDNGFVDRMLFSFPDAEIDFYNDEQMSEESIEWYSSSIISLYENVLQKVVRYDDDGEIISHKAEWSKEAKAEWKRIFNEITTIQISDEENEYMKSMFPKQKAYIPRFALLIHVLNGLKNEENYDVLEVDKDAILKAEKLSKYFVSMARKIKSNAIEVSGLRKIANNDKMTRDQKLMAMYKYDNKFNRSEASNLLGVSRQTVQAFLKNNNLK